MRRLLLLLIVGCAAGAEPTNSALPGSRYVGAAAECAPIRGEKPFAVSLSGQGPATQDARATVSASATLYFPEGRVAGAPVLIAAAGITTSMRLDATLSVRDISVHTPDCGGGWSGDLVGPAGGINAIASNNISGTSDNLRFNTGAVTLCATGDGPAQRVISVSESVTPTQEVLVRVARPVDGASFEAVTARNAFGPVPLSVRAVGDTIHIASATTVFPPFHETTFDLSGLRDILGTSLGITASPRTTPIPDLPISKGPLSISNTSLFSIGGSGAAKKIRIRHNVSCPSGYAQIRVVVVAANGVTLGLRPPCDGELVEQVLELKGTAPYAMFVAAPEGPERRPCNYYGSSPTSPPVSTYQLRSIAFE